MYDIVCELIGHEFSSADGNGQLVVIVCCCVLIVCAALFVYRIADRVFLR